MIEGIHHEQSYAHVAMMDSIRIILIIGASKDKQVYIMDIHNTFQNTMEFDLSKRTYSTLCSGKRK
jgi:hypothetical protein